MVGAMEPGTTIQVEPTAELRWVQPNVKPFLEQRWKITTYQRGVPIALRHEWRKVPMVKGSDNADGR